MSIQWFERGSFGFFAGGLNCQMREVMALRSGGHERRAWGCAHARSCSRSFILKIHLCCFLCIGDTACRLAHVQAWHRQEPVGLLGKMSFFTPFLVLVPCSCKFKTELGLWAPDDTAAGGRCVVEQRMRHSACGFVISSL